MQKRRRRMLLRMAPMIDVIFLLLLFFLVAAKWRPQEESLPLAVASSASSGIVLARPQPFTVHISQAPNGCSVQLGEDRAFAIEQIDSATRTAFENALEQSLTIRKRNLSDPVEVSCEPNVKWQYFASVYDMLYGMGLTDITFVMTKPAAEQNHAD